MPVATTEFRDLAAGTWGVREQQPDGYLDGMDTAGTLGGQPENPGDAIRDVALEFAEAAEEYNFGELLAATISGSVHASRDGECDPEDPDVVLEGVRGSTWWMPREMSSDSTFSDAAGQYRFTGLAPGSYGVVEHQP